MSALLAFLAAYVVVYLVVGSSTPHGRLARQRAAADGFMECPGSGEPSTVVVSEGFDFEKRVECPACGQPCGTMLNEDLGREVVKPHARPTEAWRP